MGMYRSINNERIGYVLNYLSNNIDDLSMTKALKLLYIIDETSIKETGTPITWLDYKVWEMGPVAIDIYNEIKRDEIFCYKGKELKVTDYINLDRITNKNNNKEEIYLRPKIAFNESLFNTYELELLHMTVFKFGNWTAKELIDYLHNEDSLWYKSVKEHNLEEYFEHISRITNYSIEFKELIQDDPVLCMAHKSSVEAMEFQQRIFDYGGNG